MILRADHDDDHDDELTLAAILLLLASRDPEHAAAYALLAEQAAIQAQGAVEKLTLDLEKAIEAAATKAEAAYHAALAEAGEAAAKAAFEAEFRVKLGGVLDTFGLAGEGGGRVDLIMSQEILNAWNEGNYSSMFGPDSADGHWRYWTEGDAKVCAFCRKLAGKIFRNDDVAAGHLLPQNHMGDRCWCTRVDGRVKAADVSDGSDYLFGLDPDWDWDKRPSFGIAA